MINIERIIADMEDDSEKDPAMEESSTTRAYWKGYRYALEVLRQRIASAALAESTKETVSKEEREALLKPLKGEDE